MELQQQHQKAVSLVVFLCVNQERHDFTLWQKTLVSILLALSQSCKI